MNRLCERVVEGQIRKIAIAIVFALLISAPSFADSVFTSGNLVVSVEGDGSGTGTYTDNQAAPLTLYQYDPTNGTSGSATFVNSLELPQTNSGANFAISGEYGSSSEGTLQLSSNGQYLTIMGYGVNALDFNSSPSSYSADGNPALGQSGSLIGQSYTAVPRVVALIDANGNVNSSTAVYNAFSANNPRSAYTVTGANGTAVYISGQGTSGDNTGGVFLATVGTINDSPTSITGPDAGTGASQGTRDIQIVNGTLYVSSDSKSGSTNRDYIGTLGTPGTAPLTLANGGNGPAMLTGYGNTGGTGKLTVTAANTNGINTVGSIVNLSPENYFFASPSVLYVADSGAPKNTSGNSALGDGGLQKWVNSEPDGSGTWTLEYTLSAGLDLVPNTQSDNPTGDDTTGLYGLTGEVADVNGLEEVELFATNFTIGDLDPTYLYGITDLLSAMAPSVGESFTEIAAAPADSNFKGVSFAPVGAPEPASFTLLALGLSGLFFAALRRKMA